MSDLQKMFVEDAPQQVNNLNNAETLSSHVLKLQALEDDIKMDEERLSKKKEQADSNISFVTPSTNNPPVTNKRNLVTKFYNYVFSDMVERAASVGTPSSIQSAGLGRQVIDIRLPLWEPTDIKGIPYYNSKENNLINLSSHPQGV